MRRHKYLFSIYKDSQYYNIPVKHTYKNLRKTRSQYLYMYRGIKYFFAGDVFIVTKNEKTFYSIVYSRLKYNEFIMSKLTKEEFEYYKSLAVENRL